MKSGMSGPRDLKVIPPNLIQISSMIEENNDGHMDRQDEPAFFIHIYAKMPKKEQRFICKSVLFWPNICRLKFTNSIDVNF